MSEYKHLIVDVDCPYCKHHYDQSYAEVFHNAYEETNKDSEFTCINCNKLIYVEWDIVTLSLFDVLLRKTPIKRCSVCDCRILCDWSNVSGLCGRCEWREQHGADEERLEDTEKV